MKRNLFPPREFLKHTGIQTFGILLAQAILLLASPVFTRVYEPADFGVYALFVSLSATLMTPATGRYDVAILLPGKHVEAINLVALCVLLVSGVAIPLGGLVYVLKDVWSGPSPDESFGIWALLLPLNVFVGASVQTMFNWTNRVRGYRGLAWARIVQSSAIVILGVAFGLAGWASVGMIASLILGRVVCLAALTGLMLKRHGLLLRHVSLARMWEQAKIYKNFPKISLFADSMNTLASSIPILAFSALFTSTITGYLSLAYTVVFAPSAVIGKAIGEVFRREASEDYRRDGKCKDIFVRTFFLLFAFSSICYGLLAVLAPTIFSLVFGPDWVTAGIYTRILTPMVFFSFLGSQLGWMPYIAQKQHYDFYWQAGLVVTVSGVAWIGLKVGDPVIMLMCQSALGSAMYVVYLYISYQLSLGSRARPGQPSEADGVLTRETSGGSD